ncbi:hypothetical protein NX059_008139 [Plenodomus lindquistii]|nr:hypothetical protein NX059_008139 [Plenodomus lindquistii]
MKVIIAVSTFVALAASALYHLRQIQVAIQNVPIHDIVSTESIPDSLDHGQAVAIVNPKRHVQIQDSRHITIKIPQSISHEEILARFIQGFFGGHVFAPERSVLRTVRTEITHFAAIKDVPVSLHIWSTSQMSNGAPPPLHALLFGAFRVLHIHVSDEISYIDFAFGSDNGAIAGVHRFSVSESAPFKGKSPNGSRFVKIKFAHSGCNPKVNKRLSPELLLTLHNWYAMLLFREGVAQVVKQI